MDSIYVPSPEDESYREFYKNKEIVSKRNRDKELRYMEQSKENLKKSVSRKIKTTMIGAISEFEKTFGYLWAHEQDRKLTPNEEKFKEMWQDVRDTILDKGNTNLRAAEDEINQYDCRWNRYSNNFVIKNQDIRRNR